MTRRTKVLTGTAVVLLVLGGAVRIVPQLLWGDGKDWSRVHSIREARVFQDAALLRKAWATPVAAPYRPGLDYQSNGSFCGPTSLVNVLRSLGRRAEQETVL